MKLRAITSEAFPCSHCDPLLIYCVKLLKVKNRIKWRSCSRVSAVAVWILVWQENVFLVTEPQTLTFTALFSRPHLSSFPVTHFLSIITNCCQHLTALAGYEADIIPIRVISFHFSGHTLSVTCSCSKKLHEDGFNLWIVLFYFGETECTFQSCDKQQLAGFLFGEQVFQFPFSKTSRSDAHLIFKSWLRDFWVCCFTDGSEQSSIWSCLTSRS